MTLDADLAHTRYDFVRKLARGGMGEVCVVKDRYLGGEYVLKVLRDDHPEMVDPEVVKDLTLRLQHEGRLLRSLEHPNLVKVVEFGFTSSGRPFLITELLHGASLKLVAKQRAPLPLAEVLDIGAQVLSGLEIMHRAGIVHRDIKPDNLFLCDAAPGSPEPARPSVKILDFGLAKLVGEGGALSGVVPKTKTGVALGTPLYMPPEQALAKPSDARSDLYSTGCALFHLATGKPPFSGDQLQLFQAHVLEEAPKPSSLLPGLPPAFDALIARALAKKPDDRFPSAEAMRKAILAIAAMQAASPAAQPSAAQPSAAQPGAAHASTAPQAPLQPAPSAAAHAAHHRATPRRTERLPDAPAHPSAAEAPPPPTLALPASAQSASPAPPHAGSARASAPHRELARAESARRATVAVQPVRRVSPERGSAIEPALLEASGRGSRASNVDLAMLSAAAGSVPRTAVQPAGSIWSFVAIGLVLGLLALGSIVAWSFLG